MLEFWLFGGCRVRGLGGQEIVLGYKLRQLLSVLLLAPNQILEADLLVGCLWGHHPPSNPTNSLHDAVKRLRKALGDADRTLIVTRYGGYGLFVDPDRLDTEQFRALATAGLKLEGPEPAGAAPLLRRALAIAKGGLPEVDPALDLRARVEELYGLREAVEEAIGRLESDPRALVPPCAEEQPLTGREKDLVQVRQSLDSQRMVTLVGPGGIGKTRLARAVGEALAGCYAGGVHLIDLADCDPRTDAVSLVVRELGLAAQPDRQPLDVLIAGLKQSNCLLILDNCEESASALAPVCDALVERCRGVRVLTTSRTALGAAREVLYEVDALDLDAAARLLIALAFPRGDDAPHHGSDEVARLTQAVAGVPLAVECAAAMVRALGLQEATRALTALPDGARLPLLDATRGGRGRHCSVELALTASYRLLESADATFFEGLSCLVGSFSRADAEAVAAPESQGYEVLFGLWRLTGASLLHQTGADRWHMLEPVRQFAATLLMRRSEHGHQAARHAGHFLGLAEQAAGASWGSSESEWIPVLDDVYPNLMKALGWMVESSFAESSLRLTALLTWYWARRGMWVEGLEASERALSVPGPAPPLVRARALVAAGHLAWWSGKSPVTESKMTEAMALVEAEPESTPAVQVLSAAIHTGLAGARMWGGADYGALTAHLEEGAHLFRVVADQAGQGFNLLTHSGVAWYRGDFTTQHEKARQALELAEDAELPYLSAVARRLLGVAEAACGDVATGRDLVERSLRASEELGDLGGLSLGWSSKGFVEVWAGNRLLGAQAFRRSIAANRKTAQVWPSVLAVGMAAEEAGLMGRPLDCLRLYTAAQQAARVTGIGLPSRDLLRVGKFVGQVAAKLAPEELQEAADQGREMMLAEAVELADEIFKMRIEGPPPVTG